MNTYEELRAYFDQWQAQGYEQRPEWYDQEIDNKINALPTTELLQLLCDLGLLK